MSQTYQKTSRVGQLAAAGDVSPETEQAPAGVPDALQARAAEEFASEVAAGRTCAVGRAQISRFWASWMTI